MKRKRKKWLSISRAGNETKCGGASGCGKEKMEGWIRVRGMGLQGRDGIGEGTGWDCRTCREEKGRDGRRREDGIGRKGKKGYGIRGEEKGRRDRIG